MKFLFVVMALFVHESSFGQADNFVSCVKLAQEMRAAKNDYVSICDLAIRKKNMLDGQFGAEESAALAIRSRKTDLTSQAASATEDAHSLIRMGQYTHGTAVEALSSCDGAHDVFKAEWKRIEDAIETHDKNATANNDISAVKQCAVDLHRVRQIGGEVQVIHMNQTLALSKARDESKIAANKSTVTRDTASNSVFNSNANVKTDPE